MAQGAARRTDKPTIRATKDNRMMGQHILAALAALGIGLPLAYTMELTPIFAGIFVGGLNCLLSLIFI